MKHISLRIDDKDYEFVRSIAKKKKVRESNLFREVFHDFVLRSTGQASMGELESILRKNSDELRDLETRIARIEGLLFSSPPRPSLGLPSSAKPVMTEDNKALSETYEQEKSSPENAKFSGHESETANGTFGSISFPSYATSELIREFARQKERKMEGEFLGHSISAAENAMKLRDYSQAARYYRIALELCGGEDLEVLGYVSEKIGDLEYLMGESDLALKYWNEALTSFLKRSNKKSNAANIYRKIGLLYVMGVYDRDKGLAAFKEALKLLEDDGTKESGEIASVYAGMARLYWRTGENLDEAERLCEKALRMAEKFSLHEVEAEVHQTLGFLLPITKKEEIMEHFQKSLRISIENGYFETTCRAYNNLGHLYVVLGGDMKRSIQFYLEGLRFERRIRHSMYCIHRNLSHHEFVVDFDCFAR